MGSQDIVMVQIVKITTIIYLNSLLYHSQPVYDTTVIQCHFPPDRTLCPNTRIVLN